MRVILVALLAAASQVLAPLLPAQAQPRRQTEVPGHQKGWDDRDTGRSLSPEARAKKARDEERAAKSAIERLPDKPFDPWRKVR
jgi:hypothetical protein